MPFLIGYGLLIAGCCLATAERVAKMERERLARGLRLVAWCGPVAAACDMTQNVALAFELGGHTGQPAPRLSQVFGDLTLAFAGVGVVAIGVGIATLVRDRVRRTST